jgi:hypothetical protein
MAMPVGSMVKKFRAEFDEAIERGVPGASLGAPSGEPAIVPPGARSVPMPARAGAVA